MSKLLLHCCCAVCASYPFLQLKEMGYDIVLYFYNPNIYPNAEYQRRLDELKKLSEMYGAKLIVEEESYDYWLNLVKGMENEPEKGARCSICFKERLGRAVLCAIKENCEYITTTLTVSPHKNSKQIFECSDEVIELLNNSEFYKENQYLSNNSTHSFFLFDFDAKRNKRIGGAEEKKKNTIPAEGLPPNQIGEQEYLGMKVKIFCHPELCKGNRRSEARTSDPASIANAKCVSGSLSEPLSMSLTPQFLKIDFKKQDGFKKTSKLADEYGFYRQEYCGCEFSIRK